MKYAGQVNWHRRLPHPSKSERATKRDLTPISAYSRFCELYAQWRGQLDVVMRQSHRAGEKLFVDYAGQTVDIVDPTSGAVQAAQIFVAVLGASSYAYAEATRTQCQVQQGLPLRAGPQPHLSGLRSPRWGGRDPRTRAQTAG